MRFAIAIASLLALEASAFFVTKTAAPRTFSLSAKPKIFIDGEAGTTGLQVRDRLLARKDLEVISIPNDLRKDDATRKKLINEADAVILCKYWYSVVECSLHVCVGHTSSYPHPLTH
jgi:hypothetical protein